MKKITLKEWTILIGVIVISLCIRFYNFENRINFGPEQGISLIVSADYLDKPSLLGQRYLRSTSIGHDLFAAPLFNYSVVPLQLLFNFDPLPITAYFAVFNVLIGLLLFWITFRITNFMVAIFTLVIFLFNDYMIAHSLFIWILNYFPLFGLLTFYWLYLLKGNHQFKYSFLLGVISGVGFGVDYAYLFFSIVVILLISWITKLNIKHLGVYVLGGVLGNLPMVIFELKHNFYNFWTLWQYLFDTIAKPSQNGIMQYHFFPYWPLLAFVGGIILYKIYTYNKVLALVLLILYIFTNLNSPIISFTSAKGMKEGMNITTWQKAAQIIASQEPVNFNVSSTIDFDGRAYPLRYLIDYQYGYKARPVEQYTDLNSLYVFKDKDSDIEQALAWEINAYKPFKVESTWNLNQSYQLIKLVK